jgi:hypothetical protein
MNAKLSRAVALLPRGQAPARHLHQNLLQQEEEEQEEEEQQKEKGRVLLLLLHHL